MPLPISTGALVAAGGPLEINSLREMLQHHVPGDEVEATHLATLRAWVEESPNPWRRDNFAPGHLTASAFVLDPSAQNVLLIFHEKLRLWLQPGGHVDDGDVDICAAAAREVAEECGLVELAPIPDLPPLVHVDVHQVPANPRKGEPPHLHFDVRFAFVSRQDTFRAGSDALAAIWAPLDHDPVVPTDLSVQRALACLRARMATRKGQ